MTMPATPTISAATRLAKAEPVVTGTASRRAG
jgi:hypothetical protein